MARSDVQPDSMFCVSSCVCALASGLARPACLCACLTVNLYKFGAFDNPNGRSEDLVSIYWNNSFSQQKMV